MHARQSLRHTQDTTSVTATHVATEQRSPHPLRNSTHSAMRVQRAAAHPGSLALGPVGDQSEQEADRVARQVVGQLSTSPSQPVQRQELDDDEEKVRLAPSTHQVDKAGMNVSSDVERGIRRVLGGGEPLPDSIRSQMERAFGADFGGVRLHSDAQAHQLNHSLQARAFTTGRDIGKDVLSSAVWESLYFSKTAEQRRIGSKALEGMGGYGKKKEKMGAGVKAPIFEIRTPGKLPAVKDLYGRVKMIFTFIVKLNQQGGGR